MSVIKGRIKRMKVLGYIVATIIVLFATSVWGGFVLCKAWGWFIVDQFNMEPIGMTTAIGLTMVVGYMTMRADNSTDKLYGQMLVRVFVNSFMKSLALLSSGWIVTLFM